MIGSPPYGYKSIFIHPVLYLEVIDFKKHCKHNSHCFEEKIK